MRLGMCAPTTFEVYRVGPKTPKAPTFDNILEAVAKSFGVFVYQIKGRNRNQRISDARHAAIMLVKRYYPTMTVTKMGKLFGNRHHSTILFSLKSAADLMKMEWMFRTKCTVIIKEFSKEFNDDKAQA